MGARGLIVVLALVWFASPLVAADAKQAPPHAPRYDLHVEFDQTHHRIHIRENVKWTNHTAKPLNDLVFNFYPHYRVPPGDYFYLAKMLELLRMQPSLGIDRNGRHGVVTDSRLLLLGMQSFKEPKLLQYEFETENPTSLRFPLPHPLAPGESVEVEIGFTLHLPNKQGRWGWWDGVTFATNAIPLLAVADDAGWHTTPFVPWAQPWFNDPGVFTATFDLPQEEVLCQPAKVKSETNLPQGIKRIETHPFLGRDFSFLCSTRFKEFTSEVKLPKGRVVSLKCLAFAEHEFYANEILRIVSEAIPVYSEWFGPFPHEQFTIVESYFGWNGNECSGLVMIDERVFGMPHLATSYVEYLVSHETCHQWWYDLIGTNGYAEPFMDEGAAAYFTHRLLDKKHGKNNTLFQWPRGLGWLPNVNREDYRWGSMYAAIRNGQMHPAAQDLPGYRSVYGLFTGAYDRGSKAYGMIEDRLGEEAFLDFIRGLTAKYGWKTLRAADLKSELEEYTGRDWTEFFDKWVYGKGVSDWEVKSVAIVDETPPLSRMGFTSKPYLKHTIIALRQSRELNEPTVLGVRMKGQNGYPIRIPVDPSGPSRIKVALSPNRKDPETDIEIEPLKDGTIQVSFTSFDSVEQVAVDPDGVLLDANPGNNVWKSEPRFRLTPLYTMLDETDLTSAQDRWNFTAGPWMWGASYADPWYTRSTMIGLRAGANRPQGFVGGGYAAYRTDYRDAVLGVDGRWRWNLEETGFNYERRIAGPWGDQDGSSGPQRASIYHRWILQQSASMYLSPMVYHETFASYTDNFLPFSRTPSPGAVRWDSAWNWGWHFRANLYTPYWDPECGVWVDAMAAVGQTRMPEWTNSGQFRLELAGVHKLPFCGPLGNIRAAMRVVGMGALPDQGQFFALGGGTLFRGYDLAERQGSSLWVGNFELRVPLVRDVEWDALDHSVGARNAWLAAFYDVGETYANGRTVGGNVSHALGAGLRVDVAVFSFIERATLRFDVAKTINDNTPFQFWFGVQHAF